MPLEHAMHAGLTMSPATCALQHKPLLQPRAAQPGTASAARVALACGSRGARSSCGRLKVGWLGQVALRQALLPAPLLLPRLLQAARCERDAQAWPGRLPQNTSACSRLQVEQAAQASVLQTPVNTCSSLAVCRAMPGWLHCPAGQPARSGSLCCSAPRSQPASTGRMHRRPGRQQAHQPVRQGPSLGHLAPRAGLLPEKLQVPGQRLQGALHALLRSGVPTELAAAWPWHRPAQLRAALPASRGLRQGASALRAQRHASVRPDPGCCHAAGPAHRCASDQAAHLHKL